MTEFDAALILDPATSESALAQYPDCASRRAAMEEACRIAVKAMRRGVRDLILDTTKMAPLTPDQLREMDGKPYWHIGLQTDSPEPHWKILDPFVARCPEDYGYGKGWLAYAYSPSPIDREAWKPCVVCGKADGCITASYCTEDPQGLTITNHNVKSVFCPKCGRPLTEEAWAELEKRLRG